MLIHKASKCARMQPSLVVLACGRCMDNVRSIPNNVLSASLNNLGFYAKLMCMQSEFSPYKRASGFNNKNIFSSDVTAYKKICCLYW